MEALRIVLFSVLAAVVYGIAHDQVTARISVEYFTIGHSPIFGTDDPTILGLGWGIIATWWMGLLLGIPLAIAARAGRRPKRSLRSLIRPVAKLLAVMAVCALVLGIVGWTLGSRGAIDLNRLSVSLPPDRQVPFLTAWFAHLASYFFGLVGGIVLIVQVWCSRARAERPPT